MTESAWHKEIKRWGVATEMAVQDRRVDCVLYCGKRAEVQRRPQPSREVASREAHADLWILDLTEAHRSGRLLVWNDPLHGQLFRWDNAWKGFAAAKRPVFLNLALDVATGQGSFLEVTNWNFDGGRAHGTGRTHTAAAMRSWMRYGTPLAQDEAVTSMGGEPRHMLDDRRHRMVVIEMDGRLQRVPAEYYPSGPLVGRMVTSGAFSPSPFSANAPDRSP